MKVAAVSLQQLCSLWSSLSPPLPSPDGTYHDCSSVIPQLGRRQGRKLIHFQDWPPKLTA